MILVTFWLKRRDALHQIAASLVDTALVTAMIFAIMIGAYVFTNFLTLSGVTRSVVNAILGLSIAPSTLIILITILYLVLGCFLDSTSMVVVTVPILHPAIVALGIDPIWYALVIIMAMEIGLLTPPVGLNVYGTQAAAEKDVSIEDVFRGSTPFFLLALLAMILMIAFPAISTTLPSLMILK
jgi:TRAP-type C4-dicarboxylate transport system permease large subunit